MNKNMFLFHLSKAQLVIGDLINFAKGNRVETPAVVPCLLQAGELLEIGKDILHLRPDHSYIRVKALLLGLQVSSFYRSNHMGVANIGLVSKYVFRK